MHPREIKIAMLEQLGSEVEDLAEKHEAEAQQRTGACSASKAAVSAIRVLMLHVTRDVEEDKLDEEGANLVRLWLQRAIESAGAIGIQSEAMKLMALGKVAGVREIVAKLEKDRDREQAMFARVGPDGRGHLEIPAAIDLAKRKEQRDRDAT